MKKLLPFILVFSLGSLFAQDVSSILEDSDIDKFIDTYKPLVKDLESLGDAYEQIQNPTTAEAMQASAEMDAVFKKHGWTGDYLQKFSTIVAGTGYVGMLKQMEGMDENQKAMMQGYAEQMKSMYGANISEADIAMIKPRYEEIVAVIQESE